MKFSIRFRILTGVVVVNLLGACIVMIYLHQSYSGGVADSASKQITETNATWKAIQSLGGSSIGAVSDPKAAAAYVKQMKDINGADYALLIDKSTIDKAAYAKARQAAGLPDNYDEGNTYVIVATTNDARSKDFAFNPKPDSVPEIGKLVGVKNGACSRLCHGSVTGSGDYWGVTWSPIPGVTEADGVVPVSQGGKPVGVLYSIQNYSQQADAARSSIVQTAIVIGVTLFIATLAIGWMIDVWVFRRLKNMTAAIEDISVRVAGGDFDAHFEPDGTTDEIGTFEEFFARFMDLISATLKALSS